MIEFLVAWLPMILVLGAFALFMGLASRDYRRQVDRVHVINDEILAINREMIVELREIKEILRDRT